MPSTLQTASPIPNTGIQNFDGLEVTGIYIVNSVQGLGEVGFSGNLEIGDTVENPRAAEKKLAIHYLLLLGDLIVDKGIVELGQPAMLTLLSNFAGLGAGVKAASFKALLDANILPADAVIV